MADLIIYTDGGARGNPGPAAVGVVIADATEKVLKEISRAIGEQTNNFAEYEALLVALEEAKKLYGEKLREMQIDVRMDSELVVRQLLGLYKVKEPNLKAQYARVKEMLHEDAPHTTFVHVPREKNARADALVNAALDALGN